ncbi:MAG TPA: hypothetical protein VGN45_11895 [Brevundimonas sp.]|jgi:hypothetical protein|nr:hypothetical protein [Brevundimonas sp.]
MRLNEFIQDTLYEIALGVEGARVKARNLVAINPSRLNGEQITEKSYVEFDVSVVVAETEESKIGGQGQANGEIKVASFVKIGGALGGQAERTNAQRAEQTHRVAFKVPLYMNANFRDNPATQAEAELWEGSRQT